MTVTLPPVGRPKFPAANGEYLTPTGHALARLLHSFRRSIPIVSARRYLVLRLERDRLRHELHMQAIAMNRLERENRELMKRMLEQPAEAKHTRAFSPVIWASHLEKKLADHLQHGNPYDG